MSMVRNNKLWVALVVCAAGMVFQVLPSGCANYLAEQVMAGFNFCSVFNCTGGTFFNFCEPVRLFVDCPQPTQTQ